MLADVECLANSDSASVLRTPLAGYVTKPAARRRPGVIGALPFPQIHLASVTLYANVKTLAAHRAKLDPHQPLDDHG
jgi:hypothetical protein